MRVKDLTAGERLFVYRRRHELSQVKAAQYWGVSLNQYRQWEADERAGAPRPALGQLQEHEQYVIQRRRSGLLAQDVAAQIGCCGEWLRLMERGERPMDRLAAFWS